MSIFLKNTTYIYIPIYYNTHDDDGFVWFMVVKLFHILKVTKQLWQLLRLIKIINEMVGQEYKDLENTFVNFFSHIVHWFAKFYSYLK